MPPVRFSSTLLAATMIVTGAACLCEKPQGANGEQALTSADTDGRENRIKRFCGDCHTFPPPESFPQNSWPREVEQGYNFYYDSRRTDLDLPPMQETIEYFRQRAPRSLRFRPTDFRTDRQGTVQFKAETIRLRVSRGPSAIAHVKWIGGASGTAELVVCDMRSGSVWIADAPLSESAFEVACQLSNPCHAEPTDLDRDGRRDFVIADLGSFLPADHQLGKVWWVRPDDDSQRWTATELMTGLGRVSDVQPADFDGDGDLDLVVAEFGWRTTGRILLLENNGIEAGTPQFVMHLVDVRHGTIHVPAVDLNGDGHLDFVAVISQEHEVIEAFLNRGDGTFRPERVFSANDPAFGSSGIQLVDLDQDGDIDVLYTNGDSFDSSVAKPYHGIRWLENRGSYPFPVRELARMPGVHRALAGDLDGDKDLDIVAVSFQPGPVLENGPDGLFDAVVWLEQDETGRFVGHRLEQNTCHHATCELVDWEGDGDLDILVGDFGWRDNPRAALTLYRNLGRLSRR